MPGGKYHKSPGPYDNDSDDETPRIDKYVPRFRRSFSHSGPRTSLGRIRSIHKPTTYLSVRCDNNRIGRPCLPLRSCANGVHCRWTLSIEEDVKTHPAYRMAPASSRMLTPAIATRQREHAPYRSSEDMSNSPVAIGITSTTRTRYRSSRPSSTKHDQHTILLPGPAARLHTLMAKRHRPLDVRTSIVIYQHSHIAATHNDHLTYRHCPWSGVPVGPRFAIQWGRCGGQAWAHQDSLAWAPVQCPHPRSRGWHLDRR